MFWLSKIFEMTYNLEQREYYSSKTRETNVYRIQSQNVY